MGLDFPCPQANEVKKISQNELIKKLQTCLTQQGEYETVRTKNSSYYAYSSNDFHFVTKFNETDAYVFCFLIFKLECHGSSNITNL